jgi:hypothetical protein
LWIGPAADGAPRQHNEIGALRAWTDVRHTGLDVTVDQSDRKRLKGYLPRQGPEILRWALYEAAKNSSHGVAPDHDYYGSVKSAHDGKIAAVSIARKLARRCYHTLRALDPQMV